MPIDPIKIPQNVYIEDRIVGPLTLKQILIVGLGAGFSYVIYGMISSTYGPPALPITIMAWVPAAVAAIFAFIRINDISMFRLLLLSIERLNKPAVRVWTPRRGITINIRTFSTPDAPAIALPTKADTQDHQFDELSVILDRSQTQESDEPSKTEIGDRQPVDPSRVSAPISSLFRDLSPHA